MKRSSACVDMTANCAPLRRRGSIFLVLLLCLFSGKIASASDDFSVRRLRQRYEVPYKLPSTTTSEPIEEEHKEPGPIVVPSHILMNIDAMENTEAYEKCFGFLDEVSEDREVTRPEYVHFLELLTDGDMAYDDFTQLPQLFMMIFYSTTCTSGQDCVHEMPTISLAPSGVSLGLLQFFCRQVLSVTFTEVSITFGYTIRYNSAEVTDEDLSKCLETATENLLLDSFGCPYGEVERRRLDLVDQLDSSDVGTKMDFLQEELERSAFRYLQESMNSFPSQAPSPAPAVADDCAYTISATVDTVIDIRTLRYP